MRKMQRRHTPTARPSLFCPTSQQLVANVRGVCFAVQEWIMEKWEEGFYITTMAGSVSGSSLVVMAKVSSSCSPRSVRVQASVSGSGREIVVVL